MRVGSRLWQSQLVRLIAASSMLLVMASQAFLPAASAVAAPLPANLSLPQVATQAPTTQVAINHAGNRVAPVSANQQLQLTISLKEQDSAGFTQFLSDLYNPKSANFHKFITPAEYGQRFGPSAQARQQVTDWLTSQGFNVTFNAQGGSTIAFRGTVAQAQNAFHVQISTYKRQDGTTFFANDRTELLPSSIANSVYGVYGLSNEVQIHNNVHVGGLINGGPNHARRGPENTGYTPTEYRNAYNIPNTYTGAGVKIAVFEVGFGAPNSGCYAGSNVDTYDAYFGLTPPARIDESVDGQLVQSNDGNGTQGEAELDIEAINAIAPQAQVLVYCGAYGAYANSGFLDTNQRIATDNMADVASESYGGDEAYFIQAGIPTFLDAENNIFRQMAAQGQSMLTSAGDTGSGSGNRAAPVPLTPQDPAAQPYITAVGGTRLYVNGTDANSSYLDETIWNRGVEGGTAGGGISNYWPLSAEPWQQGPGVNNQFSQAYANSAGAPHRQYPDISADADPTTGMAIYSNFGPPSYSNWYYIGGTSLASPLVAGMIGDAVQLGGKRLGLINPALYTLLQNAGQYNRDFHDIVKGNNDPYCVAGSGSCDNDTTIYNGIPGPYYPATPGYDIASGVGTPNVANMVPDLINLNSGSYLLVSDSLVGIGVDQNGGVVSRPITLTGIGAAAVNYTASASFTSTGLVNVTPASGTVNPSSNQTLNLNVTPGTLAAGDYIGTVTITGTVGTATVTNYTITVDVKVGTIHTSNGNSDIVLSANDTGPSPATQSIVVTTTSTTPQVYYLNIADFIGFVTVGVNGQTPVLYDTPGYFPSITVTASSPATVTFGAKLNGSLPAGSYSADVQFLSAGFFNGFSSIDQANFASFHVKLNLAGQLINATPLATNFSFNAGAATPASQIITVSEAPSFTTATDVPVTATVSPASSSSLITVTPTTATVPANGIMTFVVTPLTTSIAPGVYNSNVVFTNGLNPADKTVANVVERVQPQSMLVPSAYSLVFTTTTASPSPQTQSIKLSASGGAVSYTPSVTFQDQTPWLSINPNGGSITIPYGGSSKLNVTVDPSALGPGSYNGYITIKDNTNPTGDQPIRVAILLNVLGTGGNGTNPGSLVYPLPFLSNGANGTATFVTLQDTGVDQANVMVNYYNNDGTFITSTNTLIPPKGQSILSNSVIPTTTAVNAVILSSAPLNVLVTEGAGGANGTSAAAYNVSPSVGSTLYDPVALNGAFGGFTTTVKLYNTGNVTSTGTIQYYDQNGNLASGATANFTLAPHQVQTINQAGNAGLSSSLSYFGVISGTSGSQLAAIVTESNANARFLATFQATPNLSNSLYIPTAFKGAFGSFNTGVTLANPSSTAVSATISYVDDASGAISATETLNIPANGEASSFTPNVSGLPNGFVGSAIVSSNGALIATVNEQGAAGSGTYLAVGSPAQTVGLPAVANGAFGSFVTGATLFNVTSAPIQVNVAYYNPDGTQQGPTTTYTVSPHASVLAYQGASNLPNGFFGTVVLTSDTPNSLVATVNAAAPGIFYTYTEPTR